MYTVTKYVDTNCTHQQKNELHKGGLELRPKYVRGLNKQCNKLALSIVDIHMVIMFVCIILYNENTAVTEVCGGLQNSMYLGETASSVCSETHLTVSADGSEVSDVRMVVFQTQEEEEEDCLPLALRAVRAAHKVCYVCNIVVLTVVQTCSVSSAFWHCVVFCLVVTLW